MAVEILGYKGVMIMDDNQILDIDEYGVAYWSDGSLTMLRSPDCKHTAEECQAKFREAVNRRDNIG